MKKAISLILITIITALFLISYAFADDTRVDSSSVFTDVSSDSWYKSSVDGVFGNKFMNGISDTEFGPDHMTTRAALVTILWRMSESPKSVSEAPFTDLTQDWYKDAVLWAYENSIVNGTSEKEFSPDAILSRDALVTILYRYLGYINGDNSARADLGTFADASEISAWAQDAFSWATAEGIVTGSAGNLRPNAGATRAELATMIMRFYDKYCNVSVDNPDEDGKYQEIQCFVSSGYAESGFDYNGFDYVLSLRHPKEWSISEDQDGNYAIVRDGRTIGVIRDGTVRDMTEWKNIKYQSTSAGGVTKREYIDKKGSGSSLCFRYRFIYEYTEERTPKRITLTVDYSEVGKVSEKWLYSDSNFVPDIPESDANLGVFKDLKNGNILIVGNSFVYTSDIGNILIEMMDKNSKDCNVTAIWKANASINDYVKDRQIVSSIKDGSYDALFLCGLYSNEDKTCLDTFKEICDESGTKLVIFPAHNERRNYIDLAFEKYPEMDILDWKNEIDLFILSGKNKWEFCMDDQPLHSTPLAGYIGAHMIYRSIYGIPKKDLSDTISQKKVDSILGDYKSTGIVKTHSLTSINYFD